MSVLLRVTINVQNEIVVGYFALARLFLAWRAKRTVIQYR